MDPGTITAAIGAASAAVGLIDKIADQVERFLTDKPDPEIPKEHRMKIEARGSELVAREHGEEQVITADDFAKLPEEDLEYIKVLEVSMKNHFTLWSKVYPQRNVSADPLVNAKVDQQLQGLVSEMRDDLNGVLKFLESLGLSLDDHYMRIRHLVDQSN